MSDRKTMVEILNETRSAYGEWSTAAREAARRIDELTARVEKMERASCDTTAPEPKPAGVYVREGMRVYWKETGFTVRARTLVRGYENHIDLWHDDGEMGCLARSVLTYNGQPVLGYEEDRP